MAKQTAGVGAAKAKPAALPGIARASARQSGAATRERMLDAAEGLFAEHGYHGTSLRDVAEATDARIALVTYHFGTKDVLFNKVVERRASYMAHQRILGLDAARSKAKGGAIALEDLISAYIYPFVERSTNGGPGWKSYSQFIARLANSPDWARVISDHYDAVARQYLSEFRRTLPLVAAEDVLHGFSFMVGAMLALVAEPGRVESLSLGKFRSTNLEHMFERLLPFLAGGFEASVKAP